MEEYLASVEEVLTEWSGEPGLSGKLVDTIRDYMKLDVINNIENALSVSTVFAELQRHANCSRIRFAAMKKLMSLTNDRGDGATFSRAFIAAGGADMMITCMWTHLDDIDIQRAGCMTITKTANLHLSADGDHGDLIESPNVMNAIVDMMRRHPADAVAQELGMQAMSSLVRLEVGLIPQDQPDVPVPVPVLSQRYIVQAEAIPVLFAAIDQNIPSYMTVLGSFYLLWAMTLGDGNQEFIAYTNSHPEWQHIMERAGFLHDIPEYDTRHIRRLRIATIAAIRQMHNNAQHHGG